MTDSSPRQSSNVTEGEIVVMGSGSGSGTEIVEIPMSAQQFAIVQLTAEAVDGIGDPGLPAIARIGHHIGAFSLAPASSGVSTYGIPRTQSAKIFTRHFTGGGDLRLELTNQLEGSELPNSEAVRWRYKIAREADPLLVPGPIELLPDTPVTATLVRGRPGTRWQLSRTFSLLHEADKNYRLTLTPLVADPAWRWQVHESLDGREGFNLHDIAYGESGQIEQQINSTRLRHLRVWVDVPPGAVTRMEAATFALSLTEVPRGLPEVRRVLGNLHHQDDWRFGADGVPELAEHDYARVFVQASGCPCTAELATTPASPGAPLVWKRGGQVIAAEVGEHEIQVRVVSAIGVSAAVPFRFRSIPGPPKIEFEPTDIDPAGRIPLFEPVTFQVRANFRVTSLHFDFGPHAVPRYAQGLLPQVRFLRNGKQLVEVTATNDAGSTTEEFIVDIGAVDPGLPPLYLPQWTPLFSTGSSRLNAQYDGDPSALRWLFDEAAYPNSFTGANATPAFASAGWHRGAIGVESGGSVFKAWDFPMLVNPPGTSVIPASRIEGADFLVDLTSLAGKPFLVRDTGGDLEFLHHQAYPAAVTADTPWNSRAPVHLAPMTQTSYRALAVALWQDQPFVAVLSSGYPLRLFRVGEEESTEVSIPWSAEASEIASHMSYSVALSVWNDWIVVTLDGQTASRKPRLLQGQFPAAGADIGSDFREQIVVLPAASGPPRLEQCVLSQGVVSLVGDWKSSALLVTPMESSNGMSGSVFSPSFILANSLNRSLVAGDDDRCWWITAASLDLESPEPIELCSASFGELLDPLSWDRKVLPQPQHVGSYYGGCPVQTSAGMAVLARFQFSSRLVELRPASAGTGWEMYDRIDMLGTNLGLKHMSTTGDLLLIWGTQPGLGIGDRFLVRYR